MPLHVHVAAFHACRWKSDTFPDLADKGAFCKKCKYGKGEVER